MVQFQLIVISIVTSSTFLQFVNTQSYEHTYEYEDGFKDNEYSNHPDFGIRESSAAKVNNSNINKVKKTEYTTPYRVTTHRTTIYPRFAEPTRRVSFQQTTSPRIKPHKPDHTSHQFNKNDLVFVNEIEHTKNLSSFEDVQNIFKERNTDNTALDQSESSQFVETIYKIDHSPYSNGGYHSQITNHNFDSKNLFSTDVSAKKIIQNPNGAGYFKANGKYDSNKLSNRYNHFPIHEKLKTDLAVVNLPLQSFPRPLKNFKNQHLPYSHEFQSKPAATHGQIKLYNDDVKKYYDQILGEQLRNSKDPADKAKYHQFIKAMEDEKIEQQSPSIRDLERRPIKPGRSRPSIQHETRIKSPQKTFGLTYFKTIGIPTERPYKFPFL